MAPPVDRIATAFLKTAAENLLGLVPVVGPFLDFGVGLAQNLVDEFAEERGVTADDVADALHALPFGEAERIVDEAMSSPAGTGALHGLSETERAGLKCQLVGLPTTLEDMLHEIGRRERAEKDAAAHKARLAAIGRHAELHRLLIERLGARDYKAADKLVDQILALEPRDGRALKAQRFIDRRTGRRRILPRLVAAFVVGALVAAAVPAVDHAHRIAVAGSAPWHHPDGSYCSPYLTSPYDDPCLQDAVADVPFPARDAAELAAAGGLALALLVALVSTGLRARRLMRIWIGTRRRRLARA